MIANNPIYICDLRRAAEIVSIPAGSSVMITGATGLIGSFLMDTFIYGNRHGDGGILVTGTGRSAERLKARFGYGSCDDDDTIRLIGRSAEEPVPADEKYDYIIHLASNADPRSYALYPAETITTNILGTLNVLNYAKAHPGTRVLLASTFEVYGTVAGGGRIKEDDFGLLDFNMIRSGYPESKKAAELLVRSFVAEYGVDAVIARLCSVYGPTMTEGDNKAAAQFIRKAVNKENIVLKSKGGQRRSYCYVADAACALLTVMCRGVRGEAYNICNPQCEVTIAELAQQTAKIAGVDVVYDIPDELESRGFSQPRDSVLCADKLMSLGYQPYCSVEQGLSRSIDILSKT